MFKPVPAVTGRLPGAIFNPRFLVGLAVALSVVACPALGAVLVLVVACPAIGAVLVLVVVCPALGAVLVLAVA